MYIAADYMDKQDILWHMNIHFLFAPQTNTKT